MTDQIAQEIESVTTFYEKNLSIIQETKPAEREKVKINVRMKFFLVNEMRKRKDKFRSKPSSRPKVSLWGRR